jgi:hypothetical protein
VCGAYHGHPPLSWTYSPPRGQTPPAADEVGERTRGQLEKDAGDRGDAHDKADGLGSGPQVEGEQGEHRGPGQG